MKMDAGTFQAEALATLNDCAKLLGDASRLLGSKNAIVLIESQGLFSDLLYDFKKLIRKLPPSNGIDVVLHSLGGTIDAASALASLCRVRFDRFRVVVPFMAKSAATLLTLAADERFLTTAAQLGPVDPQIRHPEKGVWFPAHAIKEALEQVEATKDPLVKIAMADKLDPFLIGAYKDAMLASKQYVEQVVEGWPVTDKATIVSAFTDKYKSHGYPIDRIVLKNIGVPYTAMSAEAEDVVCTIHEKCVDLLDSCEDEDEEGGVIILTTEEYLFRTGNFRESGTFTTATAGAAAAAPTLGLVKKTESGA